MTENFMIFSILRWSEINFMWKKTDDEWSLCRKCMYSLHSYFGNTLDCMIVLNNNLYIAHEPTSNMVSFVDWVIPKCEIQVDLASGYSYDLSICIYWILLYSFRSTTHIVFSFSFHFSLKLIDVPSASSKGRENVIKMVCIRAIAGIIHINGHIRQLSRIQSDKNILICRES